MTVLGIAGCVVVALTLLVLAAGLALAARQHRAEKQPPPPTYRPSVQSRRLADSRRHPDDAATQRLPAVPSDD